MKTAAIQKLRRKLAQRQATYGMWVTLESASITEMAVAVGLDWVVIDAEHGHLDWGDIVAHVRATVRSDTVALVRLAELNGGAIKRALDIGADGVVIPWIETAEQLQDAVAFARYPPGGKRGIGGERATAWGACLGQSVIEADDHVLVVPMIESVRGASNMEEICRVPGADVFFLGPADFSATTGFPGQWEGPGVAEALVKIKDEILSAGKFCGVVTTGTENLMMRREQGFTLLALGLDGGLLLQTLLQRLCQAGVQRGVAPSLIPQDAETK